MEEESLIKRIVEIREKIEKTRRKTLSNIEAAQEKQTHLTKSKNKRIERKFLKNGTIVNRKNDGIVSKLAPRWLGPYKIFEHDERGNYSLQDETGSGLTQKFTLDKLKIVEKEVFDTNVGEVECILDDRTKNNKIEYLIRWKKNKIQEWISEDRFETGDIINKYWKGKQL